MSLINPSNELLIELKNMKNYDCNNLKLFYDTEENSINIEDLQVGDLIDVSYCTYSQKYYDNYSDKNFRGCVCKIFSDDMLVYYNDKNKKIVKSLKVDGCGYGFSEEDKGYWITIKKLTNK